MQLTDPLVLIELFREQAAEKRREVALIEDNIWFLDEQKEREQKDKQEKEDQERLEKIVEASAAQIADFRDRLDGYDTATVQALMDNQKAVDEILRLRERMEASAHRLPDGRVVFKTQDGTRVFDRDGAELSHETVHPETIPDAAPRWEAFKALKDSEHALLQDRQKLHEFQQRLDDARETIDKGHISADALSKMDADLRRAMPDVLKAQAPGTGKRADLDIKTSPSEATYCKDRPDLRQVPVAP